MRGTQNRCLGVLKDAHEFCHMKSDSLKALEAAALHLSPSQGRDDQQSVQMSASGLPSLMFLPLDYL